jgi:aminotransferase
VSSLSTRFTESVIREMTRLVLLHHGDQGINLAQGFPDFSAPLELKEAACAAVMADVNQYAITWGDPRLRAAIAAKCARWYGMEVDPDRQVTVCCGATETMVATLLAVLERGDEVIILEPFYENYGPDCWISGASPRYVPLRPPDWRLDPDQLAAAFSSRTRAIIVNSPHNPTGKVFSREELELIAGLCIEHDVLAITDEIYEHMVYAGEHVPLACLPLMAERTVTISGLSKTYSVTGWRLGYAIAPPAITDALRKIHDFLTVGAAAPLQLAAVTALQLPDSYYDDLLAAYRQRREHILETLGQAGFTVYPPDGAYYVMTDISGLTAESDVAFVRRLIETVGVAAVPGSSFYAEPELGRTQVRFAFPKRLATLEAARKKLVGMRSATPSPP